MPSKHENIQIKGLDSAIWLFKAIAPTVSANVANQVVVVITQLALIPLLIAKWGLEGYGTWMLMTAIPAYLSISDLGFTTAAKADMSIRVGQGDMKGAQITASSVAAILTLTLTVLGIGYFLLGSSLNWTSLFDLKNISDSQVELVLYLGFLQLASQQISLLASAQIRAAGRPATEAGLSAVARALETAALILVVFLGGDFVAAAFAWSLTRAATTALTWAALAVLLPNLMPRISLVKLKRIEELFKPSIAYTFIPVAHVISIQGLVLVLGAIMGPVAVAGFTAMRVVTRLGVSASNVLNFAYTPQYTYALVGEPRVRFAFLARTHLGLIALGTLLYLPAILFAAPWLLNLLSHNSVAPMYWVLGFLGLAAALEMFWGVAVSIGSASNQIGPLSFAWLCLAIGSLPLAAFASDQFGLSGAALVVCLSHLAMVFFSIGWGYRHSRSWLS